MENPLSFETEGVIIAIDATQTFASGFSKREFVIKVEDDKYPQDIKFEMVRDRADVLESLKVGQPVNVAFNLRGNEYKGKYYNNHVAWKVVSLGAPSHPVSNQPEQEQPATASVENLDNEDDIPF